MRTIQVNIFPEHDGGYFAEPPGWAGCYAEGATLEEVKANVQEAISVYLGEEPERFALSFEMRKHELLYDPVEYEMYPKTFTSFAELLEDLMNDDEV